MTTSAWIVIVGFAVCIGGLVWHLARMLRLPPPRDHAPQRSSPGEGVAYAFSLGMMPWVKESTRRHFTDYIRGVFLHVGIFTGFVVIALSLLSTEIHWIAAILLIGLLSLGAFNGFLGLLARLTEQNLRRLSTGDDYFSVILVTTFEVAAIAALIDGANVGAFHIVSALMLAYIPFGKIRHCLYFFFSRFYFGQFYGRRGILRLRPIKG
jgi:hypothetical protein